MKVLGITGGVGAGKSTVLRYLETKYGVKVLMTDLVGRMLQQPGEKCYRQIVESFGREILMEDGQLCRPKLADIIFHDEKKRELLNQIVHPAVKQYVKDKIEKARKHSPSGFLVVESALLLEDAYDRICDEIWYIYADPAVREKRLMESRGYTREKTAGIMASQLPHEIYQEKCNLMIDNSSDSVENTFEQIDKGLKEHGFL